MLKVYQYPLLLLPYQLIFLIITIVDVYLDVMSTGSITKMARKKIKTLAVAFTKVRSDQYEVRSSSSFSRGKSTNRKYKYAYDRKQEYALENMNDGRDF